MRCIFCKRNSNSSRSVEYIIPESLGNEEHVPPPGVVCDACNNSRSCSSKGKMDPSCPIVTMRRRLVSFWPVGSV